MGLTKRVRVAKMSAGEKSDIIEFIESGKTIKEAAYEFGRDESTVRDLMLSLRPTTALARATLKARAAEITERILDKADVDQLIDVASRPNVGVLDVIPATRGGGVNVGLGIAVSVSPGSLSAVNETEFIEGQRRKSEELGEGPTGAVKRVLQGSVAVGEFYKGD